MPKNNLDRLQNETKHVIKERIEFITGDCFTFTRLRLKNNKLYKKSYRAGGNFLMTIGLFAALNFLAKVYQYLADSSLFITSEVKSELKRLFSKKRIDEIINSLTSSEKKFFKLCFKIPPTGSTNETECFERFVKALRQDASVDLGIADKNIRDVWKDYRSALSHMAFPKKPVGVYDSDLSDKNFDEIKQMILAQPRKSFIKEGGVYTCNPDRLAIELGTIVEWLQRKIDKETDENKLEGLKRWVLNID